MRRIVFATPSHDYGSYVDYRRLVDLSGFERCRFPSMDFGSDCVYIVSPVNREFWDTARARPGARRCGIVWWNLERPDPPEIDPIQDLVTTEVHASVESVLPLVDAVWVSDRSYASARPEFKHVVMGSHPGLAEGPPLTTIYDFCHMSYVHGRRRVIDGLAREFRVGPAGFGPERERTLRSSRAMLNIHQTEAPTGEPLRFALAAAHGLPLLSERMGDPWPLQEGEHLLSFPYDRAAESLRVWLRDWAVARLAEIGSNLRTALTRDRTFRGCVEEAVARTFP